ncbi:MAG: hypothetical protein AAF810_22965 [Cyanobacteria bacterium P01_D01_bin.36]
MSKKWILLWSTLVVVLLWRLVGMPGGQIDISAGDVGVASAEITDDWLVHPPPTQAFATNDYRFEVATVDEWQTPEATGTLYKGEHVLWTKSLPQQYGPRFVVVGSQGQVLLVDEFINVASPYALMLLSTDGMPVATYSFEDIRRVLSVSAAALTREATSGWWVSAEPQLADSAPEDSVSEDSVLISTGGTYLTVDLSTGKLTTRQDL